jgi:TusA-related sulfurtransferase
MPHAMNSRRVDLRGRICPSTLLSALQEVNSVKSELRAGTLSLDILSDNRSSTTHICEAVGTMGYQVAIIKEQEHYCISISRNV